jgi:DNA-binding MarR family transcriptional regulator
MVKFFGDQGELGRLRWSIIDAMRRYGSDAGRVGHVFAAQQNLQPNDLQALVAIMSGEGSGEPLTPGRLRSVLGLSSAGTSYVIDRLVAAGHVERRRDHPTDARVVHLHYTEQGQQVGLAFFGPLGATTEAIMDQFAPDELRIVDRFMQAASRAMHDHLEREQSRSATK